MRRDAIEVGILTGKPGRAICGETFVPELRVGSGGLADAPDLRTCPACKDIYDSLPAETADIQDREPVNA